MNRKRAATIAVLFVSIAAAANCSRLGVRQNPVDKLISLCKNDNYKEAARHLVNRAKCSNPADLSQCASNYETGGAPERAAVERQCKRIKAYAAVDYEVEEEQTKPAGEITNYIYEVKIRKGTNEEEALWYFVKVNGEYVLGDIDEKD